MSFQKDNATNEDHSQKGAKISMFKFRSFDMDEITKNITECGLKQLSKRYSCDRQDCEFATNKIGNFTRH